MTEVHTTLSVAIDCTGMGGLPCLYVGTFDLHNDVTLIYFRILYCGGRHFGGQKCIAVIDSKVHVLIV